MVDSCHKCKNDTYISRFSMYVRISSGNCNRVSDVAITFKKWEIIVVKGLKTSKLILGNCRHCSKMICVCSSKSCQNCNKWQVQIWKLSQPFQHDSHMYKSPLATTLYSTSVQLSQLSQRDSYSKCTTVPLYTCYHLDKATATLKGMCHQFRIG